MKRRGNSTLGMKILLAVGLAVGLAACEMEPGETDPGPTTQELSRAQPGTSPTRNLPTQSCDNPNLCRLLEYACGQTPGHDFRCYKRDSSGGCIDGLCRQPVCFAECGGGLFGRF